MGPAAQNGPSKAEMRAFAYRLLGRREFSVLELSRRVRQKWPHAEGVDDLVAALVEENLLSDERFTESFVRARARRHQGPLRIQAELRARGVSDALITRALQPYQQRWLDLATEWLARHHSGEADLASRAKLYRKLVNRGFTHDQAMDALG